MHSARAGSRTRRLAAVSTAAGLAVGGSFVGAGSAQAIASGTAAPSNTGATGMPDYAELRAESLTAVEGGGTSFAGQAA